MQNTTIIGCYAFLHTRAKLWFPMLKLCIVDKLFFHLIFFFHLKIFFLDTLYVSLCKSVYRYIYFFEINFKLWINRTDAPISQCSRINEHPMKNKLLYYMQQFSHFNFDSEYAKVTFGNSNTNHSCSSYLLLIGFILSYFRITATYGLTLKTCLPFCIFRWDIKLGANVVRPGGYKLLPHSYSNTAMFVLSTILGKLQAYPKKKLEHILRFSMKMI